MEYKLEEFTRLMGFFFENYEKRQILYSDLKINIKKVKSINKGETKVVSLIEKDVKLFESQILKEHNETSKRFQSLESSISKVLDSLKLFLDREKMFVENKITLGDLKSDLTYYCSLRNSIPYETIQNILLNFNIEKKPMVKILNYFNHCKNVRFWIRPAIVVELLNLSLNIQISSNEVQLNHPSMESSLKIYFLLVIIFVFKMPDMFINLINDLTKK